MPRPIFGPVAGKRLKEVQRLADKAFQLLKANPRHPALRLKKADPFWSARVGSHHRALAIQVTDGLLWFCIGTQAEYGSILG